MCFICLSVVKYFKSNWCDFVILQQHEELSSRLSSYFRFSRLAAKWEAGVDFIIDSFLMAKKAEREPVT